MASRRDTMNDVVTDIPRHQISWDVDAFDDALRSQGVSLIHWTATRCPVGMTDIGDHQRPHPDHSGCQNGFLYTQAGVITALFTGNGKSKRGDELGWWDGSTVQVSTPRFYDDPPEERFYPAPFDRFYLNEESLVVPTWQLFIHHESGVDRLKYPVSKVISLTDARGDSYHEGDDFLVVGGTIQWRGTKRPTPELAIGPGMSGVGSDRGAVCSVRYLYRPYYYVGQVAHEIRVSQVSAPDGSRSIQRMPQALVLHREYLPLQRDSEAVAGTNADALRTVLGPMNGGMGAK